MQVRVIKKAELVKRIETKHAVKPAEKKINGSWLNESLRSIQAAKEREQRQFFK